MRGYALYPAASSACRYLIPLRSIQYYLRYWSYVNLLGLYSYPLDPSLTSDLKNSVGTVSSKGHTLAVRGSVKLRSSLAL
jgi:hypothetical protein